jgi:ElaB/YqjD/DUF883 family membrane-anchored ribosome-binding protein
MKNENPKDEAASVEEGGQQFITGVHEYPVSSLYPSKAKSKEECCQQLSDTVRENPTRALLIAAGAGLALALLIRSRQPRPAKFSTRLVEDLQSRLQDLTERASDLVNNGASRMQDGVDRVRDLHLDRSVRSLGQRVRALFS